MKKSGSVANKRLAPTKVRNPSAVVKRPGVERREAKHLNDADLTAVLKAAEESRYHPVLVLIAATGLRKGEALALRWDKVDLDAGVLRVAATVMRINGRLVISEPKTDRSRRVVPLPAAVVAMLRRHRTTQKEDRMRAGDQWTDSGLVFTTEFGGPVDPLNQYLFDDPKYVISLLDGCCIQSQKVTYVRIFSQCQF